MKDMHICYKKLKPDMKKVNEELGKTHKIFNYKKKDLKY